MGTLSILWQMNVYNLIWKTLNFFPCKYEFWNLQLVLVTWYEPRQDTKNVASTYFEFHVPCLPCRNEPQNRCDQCLQEMFYSSTELYTKNKFSGGLRASCRFVFLPWLCRKQNQQVHEIIKFRINFIYPSPETDKILKLTKKAKQSVTNSVAKFKCVNLWALWNRMIRNVRKAAKCPQMGVNSLIRGHKLSLLSSFSPQFRYPKNEV